MKTIKLLTSMLILVIICLLSCERTLTSTTPSESDSTKVIQDSTSTNPNITTDTIPNTNQDTVTSTIPNPDTITIDNAELYVEDIYLNNQLDNIIKLEVFRNNELSTFNLTPNDTVYFTTIEYYMYEGENYFVFPGHVAYENYIGSIDSINVFYNEKKYTYINKPYEYGELEYFFAKYIYTIVIDEGKKNYLGWE